METLIVWYKLQFVLSAVFQWLFIPATVGVGLLMAIMETLYFRKGDACYKKSAGLWKKIFAIGLAAEIISVIILSVGARISLAPSLTLAPGIFGSPLLWEGIIAFVIEAACAGFFICGCKKVSSKMNLGASWLAFVAAIVSTFWIVTVISWMQHPVGMCYNLDTASYDVIDYKDVMFNSFVIDRFFHVLFAAIFMGGILAVGVKKNVMIGATVGLVGLVGVAISGCVSMQDVAVCQPVQYAAVKGIEGAGTPSHPGIEAFLNGYSDEKGRNVDSFAKKIAAGAQTVRYSIIYDKRKEVFPDFADESKKLFEENYKHFGYGYLINSSDAVPPVKAASASYTLMIVFGVFAMLVILLVFFYSMKKKFEEAKWLKVLAAVAVPVIYLSAIFGALAAEFGKFPWAIYEHFPFTSDMRGVSNGASAVVVISAILLLVTLVIAVKFSIRGFKTDKDKESC